MFVTQLHDWELEEKDVFLERLYDHCIKAGSKYTMVWLGSKNGNFSIKSFYSSLASMRVESFPHDIVLKLFGPNESFFAWEATQARILTLKQLKRKDWRISNRCCMCKEDE